MALLTASNDAPLYQQLKDALIASIQSGEFPKGEKIPTEPELSQIYGVSRITVRRAVQELCEEDFLVKKQGKGTFVRHQKLSRKVNFLMGFSETCHASGMVPSRQVIKCEKVSVSPEDAATLGIPADGQAVMTLRVNLADGKPMMVEQNYYPSPKYDFLLEEDLSVSLFGTLWDKHGIFARFSRNCYLDVTRAIGDISTLLQVPNGEPVFFMYENEFDDNDEIIYIGKQYFLGERYRFNLQDDDRGPAKNKQQKGDVKKLPKRKCHPGKPGWHFCVKISLLMKISTKDYSNPKQGYLPVFLSDCLDLLDPVFTFDRFMEGIELHKYLKNVPAHKTGRLRYNPVNMLKTVLFGFMTSGYCSLRELEDNCKVNLRFMYLMDRQTPSYRTFGYFINEILQDSIEYLFAKINRRIFEDEHVDLQHLYIDGSKFEANANKYTWGKQRRNPDTVCMIRSLS